jgi:phytoene dehydrogenase-like protein
MPRSSVSAVSTALVVMSSGLTVTMPLVRSICYTRVADPGVVLNSTVAAVAPPGTVIVNALLASPLATVPRGRSVGASTVHGTDHPVGLAAPPQRVKLAPQDETEPKVPPKFTPPFVAATKAAVAFAPVVPTIVDDSLAPAGKHVINAFGGHAPYTLKGASWDSEKGRFMRVALDVLDEMAPGFSDQIIDVETLVPPDLEQIVGLPQGHIFHGELSLDQLFFQRPAPHCADYRTPIAGPYQCASSSHGGGGVSGIPGHNAAGEILRDWKRLE